MFRFKERVLYYVRVILRLFGAACVYGQVLRTRRNNRVVRVERRMKKCINSERCKHRVVHY